MGNEFAYEGAGMSSREWMKEWELRELHPAPSAIPRRSLGKLQCHMGAREKTTDNLDHLSPFKL